MKKINKVALSLLIAVSITTFTVAAPGPKSKKRKLNKETAYYSSKYKNADVNKCPHEAKKKSLIDFL